MNKLFVVLTILALLVLVGCGTKEAPSAPAPTLAPVKVVEIAEPEEMEEAAQATKTSPSEASEPTVTQTREITMTAKNWQFDPSTIEVNKGDHVVLTITSVDVTHGFALPDFDINVNLAPGKTVTVEFDADTAGTFDFFCSVFCGRGDDGHGHKTMRGKLVVKE